ncbi:MAG: putative colanic acid biosynthesis glycosyltransferase [Paraglaciecola sp.]|jgi:putative colanic acid biosynthesis glycosyltransferase
MKLSIVTVSFNDLEGLQHTHQSINGVTTPLSKLEIEWVVVDGGSVDGSDSFLKNCELTDSWVSEPDKGIYDAMNKGSQLCTGDYIIYLNAGDVFTQNALVILEEFIVIPSEKLYFFGAEFIAGDRKRYRSPRVFSAVKHSVPANHQAILFPRNLILKFPYNLKFSICGDYDLCARLYKSGYEAVIVNKSLVKFELGGVSTFNIRELAKEAVQIQRTVLSLNFMEISISYTRRYASMILNFIWFKFFGN